MPQAAGKKRVVHRKELEKTRTALLEAGLDAFAELGFDGATVEEIARRAGANKAMISYHFGGKEGLYKEILRANFVVAVERLRDLQASREPADVLLRRFIDGFGGMVASRPTFPAMMLREVLSGGARLDAEILPAFLDVFGTVREIINRGIREGVFRPVNPLMTHLSLIGGMVFFFATQPLRSRLAADGLLPSRMPEAAEYLAYIKEVAVRALAAEGAAPPADRGTAGRDAPDDSHAGPAGSPGRRSPGSPQGTRS